MKIIYRGLLFFLMSIEFYTASFAQECICSGPRANIKIGECDAFGGDCGPCGTCVQGDFGKWCNSSEKCPNPFGGSSVYSPPTSALISAPVTQPPAPTYSTYNCGISLPCASNVNCAQLCGNIVNAGRNICSEKGCSNLFNAMEEYIRANPHAHLTLTNIAGAIVGVNEENFFASLTPDNFADNFCAGFQCASVEATFEAASGGTPNKEVRSSKEGIPGWQSPRVAF